MKNNEREFEVTGNFGEMDVLNVSLYMKHEMSADPYGNYDLDRVNIKRVCSFIIGELGPIKALNMLHEPYRRYMKHLLNISREGSVNEKAFHNITKHGMIFLIREYIKNGGKLSKIERASSFKFPTNQVIIESYNDYYFNTSATLDKELQKYMRAKKVREVALSKIEAIESEKDPIKIAESFDIAKIPVEVFSSEYQKTRVFKTFMEKAADYLSRIDKSGDPIEVLKNKTKLGNMVKKIYRNRRLFYSNVERDMLKLVLHNYQTNICQVKNFNTVIDFLGYDQFIVTDVHKMIERYLKYFPDETVESLHEMILNEEVEERTKDLNSEKSLDLKSNISDLI